MYNRFPLKKTTKSKDFYFEYIEKKNALLRNINFRELDKIINLLKKGFKNNAILYTCGNGGSSSLSDHFTCDFIKQTNNKTQEYITHKHRYKQLSLPRTTIFLTHYKIL